MRTLLTTVAVALVAAGLGPSAARAAGDMTTAECQEHQAFVDGDPTAVAARLPSRFAPELDPASGRPLVFARAIHCDRLTIDGRGGPATMGSFGIVLRSPDGRGCGSGVPGLGAVAGDEPPVCNWYPLFWVATDRRVVDWLHDGTPDFPALYVPSLAFDLGAVDPAKGGAPFHFQAPTPTPSPFTMDDVGRERPGDLSIRGGYWADTPRGPVKVAFSTDDLTSGDATGTVRAAHGSEMASVMGADQASYPPGLSVASAERWGHAGYHKQYPAPVSPVSPGTGGASPQHAGSGMVLRLAVSPHRARLGRRTAFTLRAFTTGHVPVVGAQVRFAGRRARTGSAGTATIVAAFHRRGRHRARAAKPGFHTARAAIRVRR